MYWKSPCTFLQMLHAQIFFLQQHVDLTHKCCMQLTPSYLGLTISTGCGLGKVISNCCFLPKTVVQMYLLHCLYISKCIWWFEYFAWMNRRAKPNRLSTLDIHYMHNSINAPLNIIIMIIISVVAVIVVNVLSSTWRIHHPFFPLI